MSVQSDLGPHVVPAGVVYQTAREIETLAHRAAEFARKGPGQDLDVARRQIEKIKAIVGGGDG